MAILPVGIGSEEGNFQIERSLRFNSADSAYLSRTPASAGNKKTFTISLWIKRSALGATTALLDGDSSDGNRGEIYFDSSDRLNIYDFYVASGGLQITSARVFRDIGAWYHIVFAFDTTQATDSNRLKIYVNGVQENLANWSVGSGASRYPGQNDFSWNGTTSHWIGRTNSGSAYFNGYLSEIYNIDGSALDPTSFGEYNSETGVWQPKAYTGSYGTNGFYLDFADNSSTTALGYDAAGSNDWTPNNFSVTAGAGNDSLVDTPTPYGTDTGVGGEVRGNYCTLNPLDYYTSVPTNGNLDFTTASAAYAKSRSTIWFDIGSSDGWYAEFTLPASGTIDNLGVGVADSSVFANNYYNAGAYGIATRGAGGSFTWYKTNPSGYDGSTSVAQANGQVIGIAVKNGKVYFSINGSWILSGNPATESNPTFYGLTGNYTFFVYTYQSNSLSSNFGQRPFAYTAPSGFKALCTQNLPNPAIADGSTAMNVVTYTGNDSQSITGVGFQPDLVWVKSRSSGAYNHQLHDSVRGATAGMLASNSTAAEDSLYQFDSFDADGFTTDSGNITGVNNSGQTFVAWNWKAGGTGVSNTAGTITSTVSANTTAGFSVVTWSGTGVNGTVGHGLGNTPKLLITKNRTGTNGWNVWFDGYGADGYLILNSTDAKATYSGNWGSGTFNSTVFSVASGTWGNASGNNYVAYCFAPVEGYSAFGSYTGNGSSDGPFVYTGFRPRWVLIKSASAAGTWTLWDSARSTANSTNLTLAPNNSNAEATTINIDLTSNGFKLRHVGDINASGVTTIYAAFAENPFKYSLAR